MPPAQRAEGEKGKAEGEATGGGGAIESYYVRETVRVGARFCTLVKVKAQTAARTSCGCIFGSWA